MAGTLISDYAVDNDHWTQLLATLEKQRKGKIALSLTNYGNNNLPAIEAGSYLEIAGALYGFLAEEAISGAATTGNINYIMVDPIPITASWTLIAPTWSPSKNGWYDAGEAKRYIGACYFDTPDYQSKRVFIDRDSGTAKIYSVPLVGYAQGVMIRPFGATIQFTADGYARSGVWLPNGAIVTSFEVWLNDGGGTLTITLYRSPNASGGELEAMALRTSSGEDNTIDYPVVDTNTYKYLVRSYMADYSDQAYLYGVKIIAF